MIDSIYDPKKPSKRRVPTRHVAEGYGDGGDGRTPQQQWRLCLVLKVRSGFVLIGDGAQLVGGQSLVTGQELAVTVLTPFDSEVDTTSIHVSLKSLDLSFAFAGTTCCSCVDC